MNLFKKIICVMVLAGFVGNMSAALIGDDLMNHTEATRRLFHAVIDGRVNEVKSALADGADVMAEDNLGNTPFYYAVLIHRWEILPLLGSENNS
jgi:hypothetical protein